MNQDQTKPKNKIDVLKNLKLLGYRLAFTTPGKELTFEDLVDYAKFYLAKHSKRLLKDPIWDSYTNEEILIEYYALMYSKDPDMKKQFENQIFPELKESEELYDWFDKMEAQNKKELVDKANEMEDQVKFVPDTMGD